MADVASGRGLNGTDHGLALSVQHVVACLVDDSMDWLAVGGEDGVAVAVDLVLADPLPSVRERPTLAVLKDDGSPVSPAEGVVAGG